MEQESSSNYRSVYFLAAVFIINAILKLWYLSARDIALDEPFSIFHAQEDFSQLFEMLKTSNNAPVHFVLLHFWIKVFGISPFSVRLLSCIFSILTALVIFNTGEKLFNRKIAVIAALVFTFSNFQIFQAHDTRVYSLFALLTALSLYYFLKTILLNDTSKKNIAILIVLNILLVYSHFFGWWILTLECLSILLIKDLRKKEFIQLMSLILLATVSSYFPYIKIITERLLESAGAGTWIEKPLISDLYTMLWRFCNAPLTTVWIIVLFTVTAALYLFRQHNKIETKTQLILLWFFIPYLTMFVIAFKMPVFMDKYIVYVTIPLTFLIALSVHKISELHQKIFYPLAVITAALFVFTTKPNVDNKRRVRELVSLSKQYKKENTLVIISPHWFDLTYIYHYDINIFKDHSNYKSLMAQQNIYGIDDLTQLDSTKIKNAPDVILIDAGMNYTDPGSSTYNMLKNDFKKEEKTEIFESLRVYHFLR